MANQQPRQKQAGKVRADKHKYLLYWDLTLNPTYPQSAQRMFAKGFRDWYLVQPKTHHGRKVDGIITRTLTQLVSYLALIHAGPGNDTLNLISLIQDPTNQVENDLIRALSACLITKARGPLRSTDAKMRRNELNNTILTCENLIESVKSNEITGKEGNLVEIQEADENLPDPDAVQPSEVDRRVGEAMRGMFRAGGVMRKCEINIHGAVAVEGGE